MGIANPHFENDTLDRNSSPWIVLPGDRVMCMRADCSRQRCEPAHDNEQSVSHGPISLVEDLRVDTISATTGLHYETTSDAKWLIVKWLLGLDSNQQPSG